MAPTTMLGWLAFWQYKRPEDNQWHPLPHQERKRSDLIPPFLQRLDVTAAVIDAAPFVAAWGGAAHLRQINHFGFTAYANPFKNPTTIAAVHKGATLWMCVIGAAQLAGIDYRQYMPRFAGSFEVLRDEVAVRKHVNFGILGGAGVLLARTYFKKGPSPSLMDVIIGGSLTDLLMREYFRAHTMW